MSATTPAVPLRGRQEAPAPIDRPTETDLARSAAILEDAGYELVPILHPVRGVWHLLATAREGQVLCCVLHGEELPRAFGVLLGRPGSFPYTTRLLVHCWPDGAERPIQTTRP